MIKNNKILKDIEKLFNKYDLSGIVTIPEKGTFSLFSCNSEKIILLHHAKIELQRLDNEIKRDASSNEYINDDAEQHHPSYIK